MPNDENPIEQSNTIAGVSIARTVTQARGGVRRGMSKVLVISTLMAVLSISIIWLLAAHHAGQSHTHRMAFLPTAQGSDEIKSRAWDQSRLGAQGMAKCSAFRDVLKQTTGLQRSGRGALSQSQTVEINAALKTAKGMQPLSLKPFDCGIPLG